MSNVTISEWKQCDMLYISEIWTWSQWSPHLSPFKEQETDSAHKKKQRLIHYSYESWAVGDQPSYPPTPLIDSFDLCLAPNHSAMNPSQPIVWASHSRHGNLSWESPQTCQSPSSYIQSPDKTTVRILCLACTASFTRPTGMRMYNTPGVALASSRVLTLETLLPHHDHMSKRIWYGHCDIKKYTH